MFRGNLRVKGWMASRMVFSFMLIVFEWISGLKNYLSLTLGLRRLTTVYGLAFKGKAGVIVCWVHVIGRNSFYRLPWLYTNLFFRSSLLFFCLLIRKVGTSVKGSSSFKDSTERTLQRDFGATSKSSSKSLRSSFTAGLFPTGFYGLSFQLAVR